MQEKKKILLVTAREEALNAFIQGIEADGRFSWISVSTPEEALKTASGQGIVLVIVDGVKEKDFGLGLVKSLLSINAFIHTAVLSPMEEEDFHEYSEGLGVLARLPVKPDAAHARELLLQLQKMLIF